MSEEVQRRNVNRGFQQLRVWQHAVDLYVKTCGAMRGWPYELKTVAGQQIASTDSVHRNIAEGFARKFIKEYLNHLNIARGSLAKTVSGLLAFSRAKQISPEVFEELDGLAYKLENGLLKRVASLERKRDAGQWDDELTVRESNEVYG